MGVNVQEITDGYTFDAPAITLGVLLGDDGPVKDARIGMPLAMVNRHGLVAGATGTGKTKTLQVMAEALSTAGVPVFAADVKGDLSGLAVPGKGGEKLLARVAPLGQEWSATAHPVELYALGGEGTGIPVRATVTDFGPVLLSKVLGLNQVQESSLGLIFLHADKAGLPLLDLKDLVELLRHLASDEGKQELKSIGGVSSATLGVILRSVVTLNEQGGDVFFGEPALDPDELLRVADDGRGVISLLELPELASRPQLFSTFLMWLLAELFERLPEVGDLDKPKLVFFFDEAHLLFNGASKAFLDAITQTVRLIRSKGVGVFFVTQTPKDVPDDVLAQLGSRVQHQLRAHTPNDAKALKATVATYPVSDYDLEHVLQELGIGEAIVTVMNDRGAPTPVARTRMWAPQASMDPAPADEAQRLVQASPLLARYGESVDRESAYEILTGRMAAAAKEAEAAARADEDAAERARVEAEQAKIEAQQRKEYERAEKELERQRRADERRYEQQRAREERERERARRERDRTVQRITTTVGRELVRGLFGILKKRR
ncbi:helicase HerA-like domain-containing protein [uncultured Tessaracoccus sp.]|uniref:helicase HerA-like domain-containing protein n=1 Tax=uncultured Tessaracoccus sp. TaxID=905023 RepID=UPI0025D7FC1E|nr:helicase HerA-like domain-containing protein [uncultured Tessaracoccus sp.]